MVAFSQFFPLNPALGARVAPVGAAVAGAGVAALFLLVPAATLEDWVWASGVPALVPAAAPPLGTTARAVLALAGAGMTALVTWSMLYLLFGPGGLLAPRTVANATPVVRRADAHRDAPPRRPMTAADLGTPLMEVPAPVPVKPVAPVIERPVPADLDQPLAAFDPGAIPDRPLPAPARVAPLARTALAPGERMETYRLTPPPPTRPTERRHPATPVKPSLDALLQRLEDAAAQRMRSAAAR